jgi:hypothetical protein
VVVVMMMMMMMTVLTTRRIDSCFSPRGTRLQDKKSPCGISDGQNSSPTAAGIASSTPVLAGNQDSNNVAQ